MADLSIKTQAGGQAVIAPEQLQALAARLKGKLVLPGQDGYDEARTIWNAMIDRKPAAIVRVAHVDDVVAAVTFAREQDLVLAVKGGGHNIAGNAVCDGGLMIDLSGLKAITIDSDAKTARVGAGALLADFDAAAQAKGLVTPLGINSTTGVAGLTLGGGFGWTSRKFGLTVDNLLSAQVVTADGHVRVASASDDADLFWAIRGGGGNFGIATEFVYKLSALGPEVFAGLIVHPFDQARVLLEGYRKVVAAAPDELSAWVVMRKAPPLPFVPEQWHGREVLVFAFCYAGDPAKGEAAVAPLRALGTPIAENMGAMPFTAWQQAFDPLLTPGARNYWKSHDFRELSDGAIEAIVDAIGWLPDPESEVFIGNLGGAINRVAATATAYPHRDVNFVMNVHTRWRDPAKDKECIAWARGLFDATAAFATGGVYVNFMPSDETARVPKGAYGPNYERLTRLKKQYDPGNLFRLNQNIAPA